MKILTAEQIRAGDQQTIRQQRITAIDLMERAAQACTVSIMRINSGGRNYVVVAGKGNNGADGLAIARLLHQAGAQVEVYIIEYSEGQSAEFRHNLDYLKRSPLVKIHHVFNCEQFVVAQPVKVLIIDALFGTGIHHSTRGLPGDIIESVNALKAPVISIDLPSGLPADTQLPDGWPVIRANLTLTFQQPKLSFMFPENGAYTGAIEVLDIGIDHKFLASAESCWHYIEESEILAMLLPRPRFSHKGTFGHSLLVAGGHGRMGAAVLAAHACLCSGTGLLTAHLPGCGYEIMQTALPEAMTHIDPQHQHISCLPPLETYTAIGIGPGIGKADETAEALRQLLTAEHHCPLVLDADALNILAIHDDWKKLLPPYSILTPHPKEFDRLTQTHANSWQRLQSAQQLARDYKIIVVLKGAFTATVLPDGAVWFNSTGNPGLAKGGSGDVLTGVITGLLSRGYGPVQAAQFGVFLHGLAADLCIENIHPESLLASDVIGGLSLAFRHLYAKIESIW